MRQMHAFACWVDNEFDIVPSLGGMIQVCTAKSVKMLKGSSVITHSLHIVRVDVTVSPVDI